MPSTLVHVAVGGLIAAAMLSDTEFDVWALLAVMLAALLPDLDAFTAIFAPGTHRSLFHNVFFPVLLFTPILFDLAREHSLLEREWGPDAGRVMVAACIALVFAGIGLDAVHSGANLLWPVQDQYYAFSGILVYNAATGLENTLLDLPGSAQGTSEELYYETAVDRRIDPATGQRTPARIPFFGNGMQLLFSLLAFLIILYRLRRRYGSILDNLRKALPEGM